MEKRSSEKLESEFSLEEWRENSRNARKKSHETFKNSFPDEQKVVERNYEYLFETEKPSIYGILRELKECLIQFAEGSNAVAFRFDPEKLAEKLTYWIGEQAQDPSVKTQIKKFASYIANRFIMKEGRIKEYPVMLEEGGKSPNVFPRALADAVLGPAGYPLLPTRKKIRQDTEFSVELLPFYGSGNGSLECNVPGLIAEFLNNGFSCEGLIDKKSDGTALISVLNGGNSSSVYDFMKNLAQPTPKRRKFAMYEGIENKEDLEAKREELRNTLFPNKNAKKIFEDFFNSPVNPGLRSFFRRLKGEKHPDISLQQMLEIAEQARSNNKSKNYLASEFTVEAPHMGTADEFGPELVEHNRKAVRLFAQEVEKTLPERLKNLLKRDQLEFICLTILEYHHDSPDHNVDKELGVFSTSTVRLLARLVQNFVCHLLLSHSKKIYLDKLPLGETIINFANLPAGRNIKLERIIFNDPQVSEILSSFSNENKMELRYAIAKVMLKYNIARGFNDENGDKFEFHSVPTTYYIFQERVPAASDLESKDEVVSMTLEELYKPENFYLLEEYPQIREMIIDTFIIYFNQFHETKRVLDRSETERGIKFFLEAQYGRTPNIIVVINKTTGDIELKQIDLRDPFIEYDEKIHKRSLGLVRHGFHVLIESVVTISSLQIIGEAAEAIIKDKGDNVKPKFDREEEKYIQIGQDLVKKPYKNLRRMVKLTIKHFKHDVDLVVDDIKKLTDVNS